MNGMRRNDLNQKVCDWIVRGGIFSVDSFMLSGFMEEQLCK